MLFSQIQSILNVLLHSPHLIHAQPIRNFRILLHLLLFVLGCEFDSRPDQAAKEDSIADYLKHLKVQKNRGYRDLDAVLSCPQVLRKVDQTGVSVTTAMEAGMLQRMDDEEACHIAPTEVLLYQHAQDRRYVIGLYNGDILGYYWLSMGYLLIDIFSGCTNNKDVFMCILHFHARRAYTQHN